MTTCPPRTWFRTAPGQHPRDRLRRSLIGLLEGKSATCERLLGDPSRLHEVWAALADRRRSVSLNRSHNSAQHFDPGSKPGSPYFPYSLFGTACALSQ